ncbi:Male sterility NAD-binding [Penicillium canariense]|uniref:Fatty acyl-CoA reductase n=1 Tax=Penicillium canariense TaxID=189055 RepID=A0A9W9LIJ3_9EURO|nr:Male sterility NAD-binding [Penicillium canariense]KAJ5157107.1 Male sterility NAD-binding [Penicillium canariense]
MIWEYYNGKILFVTGGTGFIGTAVLYRLLTQATPKHVYVLCRGGFTKAESKWNNMLPVSIANTLTRSKCMTILDGELGDTATMNLPDEDLQMLKRRVHILIHAASSIELKNSLRELSYSVIAPTLCLTKYALKFQNLEKFVFLSSAYVNAHLWKLSESSDVAVQERVYTLDGKSEDIYESAPAIWRELQTNGTSQEYESHDFPWPYAYAKHLAERLILQKASEQNALDKILIIRPSVVGPADEFPYHGFTTSYSTPSTACAAAYAIHPRRKIVLATRCENPDQEATIDEVPVDVVADRLLVHTAVGSSGCVHAVSGEKRRLRLEDWWVAFKNERRLPWHVKPVWTKEDWHSSNLHHIARNFKIIGTSFAFAEDKSDQVADTLTSDDLEHLNLFADRSRPYHHSLIHRRHHIHHLAKQMAKKNKIPACMAGLFCHKGKPPQHHQIQNEKATA